MSIGKVADAISKVSGVVDGLTMSKEEKANIDLEFNKLQTEINKVEADNDNVFVSGWRPFIGWVCGSGLAFNYVLRPLINYFLIFADIQQMPSLEIEALFPLIMGMLGFGAMRSYEKKNQVARRGGLFRRKK